MKARQFYFKRIWAPVEKISSGIVSGIPRQNIVIRPENKTFLQNRKERLKVDPEKHYHRPVSKPAVEKQTVMKERKKEKGVH